MDYLLLDKLPLFAEFVAQDAPHLTSNFHVCVGQVLEPDAIPLLGMLLLHQALVPLSAGIGRLGREVLGSDLTPVQALGAGSDQVLIILLRPRTTPRAASGGEGVAVGQGRSVRFRHAGNHGEDYDEMESEWMCIMIIGLATKGSNVDREVMVEGW